MLRCTLRCVTETHQPYDIVLFVAKPSQSVLKYSDLLLLYTGLHGKVTHENTKF